MPFAQSFPLGGNGDILMDLVRRMEVLEGRARVIQNGSIVFTDANNNVVGVLGQQVDGNMGLRFFDTAGNLRTALGHLPSGDYGLAVTDTAGNTEEILPSVQGYVSATVNITSNTYVSSGGPSVTAVVGASGKVRVDASATVWQNTAADAAWYGLFVDGTFNIDLVEVESAGGQVVAGCHASVIVSTLSAGSHTFEMQYHTSGGVTSQFQRRSLIVTPL